MRRLFACTIAVGLSAIAGGFWGGFETSRVDRSSALAIHGGAGPLELKIRPRSVVAGAAGERLLFDAEIATKFVGSGRVALSYILSDGKGQQIGQVESSASQDIESGGQVFSELETSEGLQDGVYQLRAVVVALGELEAAGADDSAFAVEQSAFFRVESGRVVPISANDWYRSTAVDQTRRDVDGYSEPTTEYKSVEDYLATRENRIARTIEQRGR